MLQASAAKCTWHARFSSPGSRAGVSCCFRTAASKNCIIPVPPQRQSTFNGTINGSTFSRAGAFRGFAEAVLTACVHTTTGARDDASRVTPGPLPSPCSARISSTNVPGLGIRESGACHGWQRTAVAQQTGVCCHKEVGSAPVPQGRGQGAELTAPCSRCWKLWQPPGSGGGRAGHGRRKPHISSERGEHSASSTPMNSPSCSSLPRTLPCEGHGGNPRFAPRFPNGGGGELKSHHTRPGPARPSAGCGQGSGRSLRCH